MDVREAGKTRNRSDQPLPDAPAAPAGAQLLASRLGLLDSPPQEAFDRLTRMAAAAAGAPVAVLLLDDVLVSHFGLEEELATRGRVPLSESQLQRIAASERPLSGGEWAAAPVCCEGHRVGVLCAISAPGRTSRGQELAALDDLAALAGSELDLRSALLDRDRAEITLRDSEGHIRRAFDLARIGMIIVSADPRSAGTIMRVNQACCGFFGRTECELVGMNVIELTHPDDVELSHRAIGSIVDGETSYLRGIEKRYLHPLGHTIWGELTTSAIAAHDEQPAYMISIVEDITERKQAELDLPAIANVVRRILSGEDAREAIVQAAVDIAGASSAHLAERNGPSTITVTASSGLNLVGVDIQLDAPSATADVFLGGQPKFIADPERDPLVSSELLVMSRARSIMWQPILSHGGVIGVLCVCWSERLESVSTRAARAVALLTDETAVALAHHDALRRLAAQATTDPLTGLPNRRAWDERLTRELAIAARREHPLTLALLDMDRFKHFNDTRGHSAGDELLNEFSIHARELLREGDELARWGGEEFAVLLPDCPSDAFAASILDRIRSVVPAGQSCSIGYATWDRRETAETLVKRADRALYRAKAMGRDRAVCADSLRGVGAWPAGA
ncbi:MAG TPA: diguanylate cyclase [Solirubrobacteraceae bacterium]|nr:diguanylate cyclase [Solirubrobacteraceae bacterium]